MISDNHDNRSSKENFPQEVGLFLNTVMHCAKSGDMAAYVVTGAAEAAVLTVAEVQACAKLPIASAVLYIS